MDPFQKSDNKQFLENMYQHTRYTNNIKKHQALTLFAQPSSNNFSLDLHEPLKIDKISDVYLDNFTTYNSLLCDKIHLYRYHCSGFLVLKGTTVVYC